MFKQTALAIAMATAAASALAADVAYPEKFRDGRHVKSMVINKGHPLYNAVGGMHHIYGNAKAIAGYKTGKFANGSVITFDLFEAVDKDNAVTEGAHKAVVVMARDSKKYAATDGWGYQVFDPKTRKGSLDAKAQGECHACHIAQKEKDFVFSAPRD
jgi:hypothetical protein